MEMMGEEGKGENVGVKNSASRALIGFRISPALFLRLINSWFDGRSIRLPRLVVFRLILITKEINL